MEPLVKLIENAAPRASLLLLSRSPVNALNTPLLRSISSTIADLDARRGSEGHGLVLSSSNPAIFSAGLDLEEMYNKPTSSVREFWSLVQDVFLSLYGTRLAMVASIPGPCPAGGCMMALACDYRLAASDAPKAKIGLNEAKFGLVPPFFFKDMMERTVGTRRAEILLQRGDLISLNDAFGMGMIDELAPGASLTKVALQRAEEWAGNGPAEARHATKMVCRGDVIQKLRDSREENVEWFVERVMRKETQENLGKYLQSLKKPR